MNDGRWTMDDERLRLTIDGQEVTAPAGETILHAAQHVGIRIPTLCHLHETRDIGACRLCVVEVEGAPTLVASCHTPVAEGKVVHTASPAVMEARRVLLRLALGPNGGRDGDPPLQTAARWVPEILRLAEELGVDMSGAGAETRPYSRRIKKALRRFDDPLILRDSSQCIRCDRCVRYCSIFQQVPVLARVGRGAASHVTTISDLPYKSTECQHCGGCITVCPTAALVESWRYWHGDGEARGPTICPYCGAGCSLFVHVKDGEIVGVSPDPEGSVNEGHLCVKGRTAFDFVHHPDRLTAPLIRDEKARGRFPGFREATWDEALGVVAERLSAIRDGFGPHAIGGISSSRNTNEENYLMMKFMRTVIGTNNVDNCARVCHSPSVSGLSAALGGGAATNTLDEMDLADVILVIGANVTEAHPVLGVKVKRAVSQGSRLIVVDPRRIWLTRIADHHLALKPGTNVALINGLMHILLAEGLEDREFIAQRTEGIETLRQVVEIYTPEKVSEITGVPAGDVVAAARLYGSASRAMILYGLGVTEHITGTHGVMSCANLALLTGNLGKPGTGINPLRGQNNVQGACDMGALPNLLTGYQSVNDPAARERFASAWACTVPEDRGLRSTEMWDAALAGALRAMYIVAEDPARTDPNTNEVRRALDALDFLVVQEIFLTDTARYADVILPAASFAEKDGTFTNADRRIQLVQKVIDPIGETKADLDILCELSERMGHPWQARIAEAVMGEIARLTPSMAGVSYRRLRTEGYLRWPCLDESDPGADVLYETEFARGKGKFHDLMYSPSAEETDGEYPFILTTGRRLEHYNCGSMTLRTQVLKDLVPEEMLEMHPDDAESLGIEDGDWIRVSSRRGELTVRARVTDRSQPGVVFLSFHFPDVPTNRLLGTELDPIAATPEYKVSAVRIERVELSVA